MTYIYKTPHSFDGENEVSLVITYYYSPANNGSGPSYDSGGEPPEPAEIELLWVMVDGLTSTTEQFLQVLENERIWEEMAQNAEETVADQREAAAESRNDSRRD